VAATSAMSQAPLRFTTEAAAPDSGVEASAGFSA